MTYKEKMRYDHSISVLNFSVAKFKLESALIDLYNVAMDSDACENAIRHVELAIHDIEYARDVSDRVWETYKNE